MAATSSEPAGGWQTPSPGTCAPSPNAFPPVCRNDETVRLPREIEAVDRTRDPAGREICFGPFRVLPARRLLLEGDKPVRIGSRALDLLIALVERSGEVVSKPELLARVWPHACVEEGNLKVHIAVLRRMFADGQAGNRYISTVAGRGYCFVAPITLSGGSDPATARPLAVEPLTNVPAPLLQLIGRDEVVSSVSTQLAHNRLITLVGPAGIGKTSVAIATAKGLTESYQHGVWFVDLAATADPTGLPAAISAAIRLDFSAEDRLDRLLSFLSDKRMLLVFDNCEHVIEAIAALAFQVLRAAPSAQILATSREPLGVEGEQLHHVQPLGFPLGSRGLGASEALEYPAIQLFVERAGHVLGELKLRDRDVPVVIDICRKLDGIPLAIDLAADSIDAFGLRGLASHLEHPLRLPAARRRTAPPRHRSLRAALDWSYRLLTEEEQRVLRRLSVLADSFSIDAAATVAADPTCTEGEVVERIIALIAKSLVAADADGSEETRLRLLAATRVYALERLAESGELEAIQQRHAGISQYSAGAAA